VNMSAHVQHRSRSLWEDRPQGHGQDHGRNRPEPLASAVLPRGRRLLRQPSDNKSVYSIVATRSKSMEPYTAVSDAYRRSRPSGRVMPSAPPARGSLAAWQQIVLTAYVEKHIAESITVRALARFVCLSSDCFRRAFKGSFGMPPRRYLAERRIERAKTLLAYSECSVSSIGLALGFSQTSSFSAAFRHVTGMTPTEFRKA
jgi:AraC-like DNA-binding protein